MVESKRKTRVLFICTANQMRSRTAEDLYRDDPRFDVKSAGTMSFAVRVVDEDLVTWSDAIVVMEDHHRRELLDSFPCLIDQKRLFCLRIPDIFEYMDRRLIGLLRKRIERIAGKITGAA